MPDEDTGQGRLLQLGYLQQLPRVLSWQQNAAICFSIMSATTGISGTHTCPRMEPGPRQDYGNVWEET